MRKRGSGDFVSAGTIYFGQWLSIDDVNLEAHETPETILLKKDGILSLPKECRLMAEIILSMPEEMFLVNGKIKKEALRRVVRNKTGWSLSRIDGVRKRLGNFLTDQHRQKS
jgi:hypothetical protein